MSNDTHHSTAFHGEDCNIAGSQAVAVHEGASRGRQTELLVEGMDCADEVQALQQSFKALPGVREFKANLMASTITIAHESSIAPDELVARVEAAGLRVKVKTDFHAEDDSSTQGKRLASVITSGILTGLGLLFQWQGVFEPYGKIGGCAAAITAGGWFILPKAWRAIRQRSLDMNVLMTVAVVGAAMIGEWTEGAAVTFLFALSELLESFSIFRARRAIKALLELAPETALVKRGEQFVELPVQEIAVGELIAIKSGERIPLDGIILTGESAVNQAPITGESMPVEKKAEDNVFAGTINGEGALEVRVSKAYTDTTLAQIIRLVGEAQAEKAPSQRFVDRFARIYTPAVFVGAVLVFLIGVFVLNGDWNSWIYRSLVLLVIACPCALVISTPVSIVSGLTAMARRGVLIKGGTFLEEIGRLKALAVDKTGTITEGNPRVIEILAQNDKSESEVVRIAASIDAHSSHPLARAVLAYANEKGIQFERSTSYQSKTGRGAEGIIDRHEYFVGNHRFAHELGVCTPELELKLKQIEERALSVIVVGHKPHSGHDGEVLGVLSIGDAIRPNAIAAIQRLHDAGVKKVIMLSGDNQLTVDSISKQVGIDEALGDLLPADKVERVKSLTAQYRHVGMIGDGVNDAPAMAVASIGIAMGGAGTDTAIETADITLMQDDLSKVGEAVQLGRRTVRIIQANITFALGIKAVFLVLALIGKTSLWLAILADTGATLVVIGNALRLLRISEPKQTKATP